jgi:hypothetical protein
LVINKKKKKERKEKKRHEAKTETAKIQFLRSVAGYTRQGQMRNTKITEELNIFISNNKKSRLQIKVEINE